MRKKGIYRMLLLLCSVLMLGALSLPARAEETIEAEEEFDVFFEPGDITNEELFEGYVNRLFYSSYPQAPFSTGEESAGARLTGDEKLAYDALVPFITQVASGQRASSMITLGQDAASEVWVSFQNACTSLNYQDVVYALRLDYPYEFYWFHVYTEGWYKISWNRTHITFKFTVTPEFRGSDIYTADTAKTAAATVAARNAKDIVARYAGLSAYETLLGYKEEIIARVSYDHGADSDLGMGPWSVINTFDDDPDTNVVCGGYAVSFQYLCDMGGFTCYYVTGYTSGYHAWNIVTLEGKNYLVDVTGSEESSWGSDGSLFLAGGPGSVAEGYRISHRTYGDNYTMQYTYEDKMLTTWGEAILTLAEKPYCLHEYSSAMTAPSCTEEGYTTHVCSLCGESYVDGQQPPTGHDLGSWTIIRELTETENGEARRECQNCSYYETKVIGLSGDINLDRQVQDLDAVYLLWHCAFRETYPLSVSGDVNGDSYVTEDDAVYLLWHTLFPQMYPIG